MGVEKAEVVRDDDDVPHGDTGAFAGQRWGTRAIDIDFHPDPGTPMTPLAKGGGHVDLPAAPCPGQD